MTQSKPSTTPRQQRMPTVSWGQTIVKRIDSLTSGSASDPVKRIDSLTTHRTYENYEVFSYFRCTLHASSP